MADAQPTVYALLGGEEPLARVVRRFYDVMFTEPALAPLAAMHVDRPRAEARLFEFLSGWMGGPNLYWERHGHPMLRRRHFPFAIDTRARDQWLWCMAKALRDEGVDAALQDALMAAFEGVADHMRNRPD